MITVAIYDARDVGLGFTVIEWRVIPGFIASSKVLGAHVIDLAAARDVVPMGMVKVGRSPKDDPKIVEVWI